MDKFLKPSRLTKYIAIVLVLLFAAFMRWSDVGGEVFSTDGTQLFLKSIRLARYGDFTFIGPPMSAGTSHSPFTVYLYALPALITPDERIAIMFTGALSLITAALMYKICSRYFSVAAGLIATILFAVHPEALFISRQILNTVLAPPFVMAYIFTGLLGYYENKSYARWIHIPLIFLAAQCHPGSIFLSPITVVLFFYALWRYPTQRKQIFIESLLGGIIAVALLTPWVIGILQQTQGRDPSSAIEIGASRGVNYILEQVISAITSWENGFAKTILLPLTILGIGWMLFRALLRRDSIPNVVVVLGLVVSPFLFWILNVKFRDTYFWPAYSTLFIILGAVLGGVRQKGAHKIFYWRGLLPTPYIGWSALVIVALIVYNHIDFSIRDVNMPPTINDFSRSLNTADQLAKQSGRDLIMLTPYGADAEAEYMIWEALRETHLDSRVIWNGRAMPLPSKGAVLLGPSTYDGRPFIFSNGSIINSKLRLAELPPADQFKPDLPLPKPIAFDNGVTVFGFLKLSPTDTPQAGKMWTVFMLWRQDELKNQENGIFVHLINEKGDKFAQVDVSALPVGQQRIGEMAMSQLDFKLSADLPKDGELFLRFGFTDDGNVLGTSTTQIRGASQPAMTWENGLSLNRLVANEKTPQGPPLELKATWFSIKDLSDLVVRFSVKSSNGQVVYEKSEDLKIPANVFLSSNYELRIPADTAAGVYAIEVALADSRGNKVGDSYKVNAEVTARPRKFQSPSMQKTVNASFADQLRLLGYDLKLDGKKLNIALHWQSIGQIPNSYKFFVHVLREGEVKTQIDALPSQGNYLTSWWALNEVYSETIVLDVASLEAGSYTISTGWYDATSQQRLGDVVTLQEIELK